MLAYSILGTLSPRLQVDRDNPKFMSDSVRRGVSLGIDIEFNCKLTPSKQGEKNTETPYINEVNAE
jgi:hypothetical protein